MNRRVVTTIAGVLIITVAALVYRWTHKPSTPPPVTLIDLKTE